MKILSIVGARPQFIKLATIVHELKKHKVEHIIVHTGQHYDYSMSKLFFKELEIPEPDYNLEVGSGTHGLQTGLMLERIEKVLLSCKPDIVLVYGDTNSTLAGALASVKLHIKLGHVEAGLRSYNRRMPEEINRVLADRVSDMLFCPTETSVKNLKEEGIENSVYLTGDVMYDMILKYRDLITKCSKQILEQFELENGKYCYATIHRAENTDVKERLLNIIHALDEISRKIKVVFPVHPRTKKSLESINYKPNCLLMINPVSYLESLSLISNAKMVFTDSGGVQKEAYILQRPCITLRDETEWVETVNNGWNILVGADYEKIIQVYKEFTPSEKNYKNDIFGKGDAVHKIIDILLTNT